MEPSLQAQIDTNRSHLDALIRRGQQVAANLAADPSDKSAILATRLWQEDCGTAINQLSGGSKSHWLARSFSHAFLMRSAVGDAIEGADPVEIINRLLGVLEQAIASLSQMSLSQTTMPDASADSEAPAPRRFEFVHNPEIRPVVELAYVESRRALEAADYDGALRTSCGILEAIVTDALEHKGLSALVASGAPTSKIADWSFDTRIAVAERAGLIRNGCARLPVVARTYRDHADIGREASPTISERDARIAGQVLNVVMRDLDPGR
jgi:hypothetical protein